MTRQTNLKIIRAACVAANPDKTCPVEDSGDFCAIHKIRLSDVLLAIKSSPKCDTYWEYEAASSVIWGKPMHGENPWNLRDDTLDAQSDATLSFLGGLLG